MAICSPAVAKWFRTYKTLLIFVLTPIIYLPIPIIASTEAGRAAYAIAIMATFWISEVTSLAVTSLLPLLLFPFLGVLKAKVVCMEYMKDTNILLLGGLLIAVAIERWNVHRRVALKVLLLVGAQPRRLMLGFMMTTAFISMWITNTATTAMMTPIMEAVLKQLDKQYVDGDDEEEDESLSANSTVKYNPHDKTHLLSTNNGATIVLNQEDLAIELEKDEKIVPREDTTEKKTTMTPKQQKKHQQLCKAMLLCICYSANIGGTGTLTGTAPQLVLSGQVDEIFSKGPAISFIYWFVYACPQMIMFMAVAWLYLQAFFIGISWKHICCCFRGEKRNSKKGKNLEIIMKRQYEELGPIAFAEIEVMLCFLALVLLWFFREPKFMPGWGELFKDKYISDGTTAMIIGFALFLLPSTKPSMFKSKREKEEEERAPVQQKFLLQWEHVQTVFPWNVLLLLGAGFALAKACEVSKLSLWLSCQLSGLKVLPQFAIVIIICVLITFLTEITSNTATATILLPVLASLSQSIEVHPYYLMIPATVCASFAFMLPVATPPNAIVFATGRLTVPDMAKAGFGMNIIGILIVTLSINTWGYAYYGLGTFPDWATDGSAINKCLGNATAF